MKNFKSDIVQENIIFTISQCDDSKALREDWFFDSLLKDRDLGKT
jgi:hypothetical protein